MAEEGPICSLSLSWNIHFSFLETLELLVLGPLNSGRIIPLDFPVPQFVNYGIYRPPYHIDGEKMKTLPDFIFLGSKITVDGDCSHKIKRHLLLGWKAMANPDSILKSRDHFDDKGPHSGSYGFSSRLYMDVSVGQWRRAEQWRIVGFELWCWRRLLRVLWTVRRSNQSILQEISPEYSLEGLMLKLKLQYFSHLMQRANSLEKTLILGKTEIRRRRWWRMKWLDVITDWMDINLSKRQEIVKDRKAWHATVCGIAELDTVDWLNSMSQMNQPTVTHEPNPVISLSVSLHRMVQHSCKNFLSQLTFSLINFYYCIQEEFSTPFYSPISYNLDILLCLFVVAFVVLSIDSETYLWFALWTFNVITSTSKS